MAAGGGAWKVAYADFVTAMMAFFLVMWITSQSDEVKEAIGGYFQDPWGMDVESHAPHLHAPTGITGDAPFSDAPTGILPNRHPQTNIEGATERDPGAASVWQQKQRLHLLNNSDRNLPALVVNFSEASAELPLAAKQRLSALMPALMGKRNKIEIRAHSTRRPLPKDGAFKDHWQLCYERSQVVLKYLEEHGIESDRIRLSQSAANEPLTNRLETAWQDENNCVEIFLLTLVAEQAPGTAVAKPVAAAPKSGKNISAKPPEEPLPATTSAVSTGTHGGH